MGKYLATPDKEAQMREAESMLVDGFSYVEISKKFEEEFGISSTATQDIIRGVHNRWASLPKPDVEFERSLQVNRLLSLYRQADIDQKIQIEKVLSKLLGTERPQEVSVKTDFWSELMNMKQQALMLKGVVINEGEKAKLDAIIDGVPTPKELNEPSSSNTD